jgi:hypothetical protein
MVVFYKLSDTRNFNKSNIAHNIFFLTKIYFTPIQCISIVLSAALINRLVRVGPFEKKPIIGLY